MTYPYNDEYMTFDESTQRYILTAKYAYERLGIDLESSVKQRGGVNAQILVNHFLEEVSDDIYGYIHKYNINTAKQDMLIACIPSLRGIIQKAMGQQLLYSRLNGLLGYAVEKEKRENRISEKAIDTLNQIIPEIGISILYTGRI